MIETKRVESALGTWTQSSWEPARDDRLFGSVKRIWDFEGALGFRRERIFPTGLLELVVQLDQPHRPVTTTGCEPFPALCIDGLAMTSSTIEAPPGRCRVLGMSLFPLGAFTLLGTALGDLTARSLDLRVVIGSRADQLADSLASARRGSERVEEAVRWARRQAATACRPDEAVASILARIHRDANVPILQLAELTGRSRSRFAAAFRDQVGVTPKRYARVVRFRRALETIGLGGTPLSAVATASGYYDQAHMNVEFREHAGLSPRAYLGGTRFPNSDHLAER